MFCVTLRTPNRNCLQIWEHVAELQGLDLSRNSLAGFPHTRLAELRNLRVILLAGNQLSTWPLPLQPGALPQLRELDVSDNPLEAPPRGRLACCAASLTALDVSGEVATWSAGRLRGLRCREASASRESLLSPWVGCRLAVTCCWRFQGAGAVPRAADRESGTLRPPLLPTCAVEPAGSGGDLLGSKQPGAGEHRSPLIESWLHWTTKRVQLEESGRYLCVAWQHDLKEASTPRSGKAQLSQVINAFLQVPEGITKLSALTRLDLTDNSLGSLPPRLGLLGPSLRVLELQGNPLRTIRRATLDKGTRAILDHLKDRIPA